MFLKDGCYTAHKVSKCVIFPKGKNSWEGFVPPCKFKDGDIIFTHTNTSKGFLENSWVSIFKEYRNNRCACYVCLCLSDLELYHDKWEDELLCELCEIEENRLATEEEKEKLFDAIKDKGYRWNAETKTLDKIEIESRCTYKEFIHYLADKAIGDKREIIKAFDNNEHNRFIGYLQVTKRLINGKLFILFKVDGRELEAEWQASKNYGVWQERGWSGESYNGYLLFPTYKDNEYFVLWYKC
jgi:hypothetical protein